MKCQSKPGLPIFHKNTTILLSIFFTLFNIFEYATPLYAARPQSIYEEALLEGRDAEQPDYADAKSLGTDRDLVDLEKQMKSGKDTALIFEYIQKLIRAGRTNAQIIQSLTLLLRNEELGDFFKDAVAGEMRKFISESYNISQKEVLQILSETANAFEAFELLMELKDVTGQTTEDVVALLKAVSETNTSYVKWREEGRYLEKISGFLVIVAQAVKEGGADKSLLDVERFLKITHGFTTGGSDEDFESLRRLIEAVRDREADPSVLGKLLDRSIVNADANHEFYIYFDPLLSLGKAVQAGVIDGEMMETMFFYYASRVNQVGGSHYDPLISLTRAVRFGVLAPSTFNLNFFIAFIENLVLEGGGGEDWGGHFIAFWEKLDLTLEMVAENNDEDYQRFVRNWSMRFFEEAEASLFVPIILSLGIDSKQGVKEQLDRIDDVFRKYEELSEDAKEEFYRKLDKVFKLTNGTTEEYYVPHKHTPEVLEVLESIDAIGLERVLTQLDRLKEGWETTAQGGVVTEEDEVDAKSLGTDRDKVKAALKQYGAHEDEEDLKALLAAVGRAGGVKAVLEREDLPSLNRVIDSLYSWDGERLRSRVVANYGSPLDRVSIHPDGSQIVTIGLDQRVTIWDMLTGKRTASASDADAAYFTPDGNKVLISQNQGINTLFWTPFESLTVSPSTPHEIFYRSTPFSRDGSLFIRYLVISEPAPNDLVGEWVTRVQVLDWKTQESLYMIESEAIPSAAFVALSPDNKRMALTSLNFMDEGRRLEVWDTETQQRIPGFDLNPMQEADSVTVITITPDSKKVVTSSEDGIVRVWDINTGERLLMFRGHRDIEEDGGFVDDVLTITPDGQQIVTGYRDGTLRMWDIQTGEERQRLEGHSGGIQDVVITPDQKKFVTVGNDGTVRVLYANIDPAFTEYEQGLFPNEVFPERVSGASLGTEDEADAKSLGSVNVSVLDNLKESINVFIGRDIDNFSRAQLDEIFKLAARNPKQLQVVVTNAGSYDKQPLLNLPNIHFTPQNAREAAKGIRKAQHNLHLSRTIDPAEDFTLVGDNKFRYPNEENGLLGVALLYTQSENPLAFLTKYGLRKVDGFFSAVGEALLALVQSHEADLAIARAA